MPTTVLTHSYVPPSTDSATASSSSQPRKATKNWDNITTTILSQDTEKTIGDDPNAGGDGVVTTAKALVTTGLVVSHEALTWLGEYLNAGKAKAKEATTNSDGSANGPAN